MTITVDARATDAAFTTRQLIRAGIVAGPLFALAGFAQMPFREGFDPTRHAFSFLLIGPQGWLEAVVFVVAGVLYAVAGIGLLRVVPRRAGRIAGIFAILLGAGKVIAGLNAPQPSYGYPIGTPDGPPAVLSNASILHAVGFGLAVLAWAGLLITLCVALRRAGDSRAALLALVTAVALPLVPATSGQPFGTVLLYVVVTSAYAITSVLLHRIATTRADARS